MSFPNVLVATIQSLKNKMDELLYEIQLNREMIEELRDIVRNENIVVSDYYNSIGDTDESEDSLG